MSNILSLNVGDRVKISAGKSMLSMVLQGKSGIIKKIKSNGTNYYAILDIDENNRGIWLSELTLIRNNWDK